jgi:hypothetical protein
LINILATIPLTLSRANKTTRTGIKPKTQQGKQIIRNASPSLIQDYKHKNAKQKYDIY